MIQPLTSNSSLINKFNLKDATLYYYNQRPMLNIETFSDALNTALWRDYLKPFACIIADNNSDDVILVRDHIGLEPLYYCHHQGKKLLFAQSIPEILKQLPSTPPLLESQIDMLFSQHNFYSDETN